MRKVYNYIKTHREKRLIQLSLYWQRHFPRLVSYFFLQYQYNVMQLGNEN